jgi:hypothetical protein
VVIAYVWSASPTATPTITGVIPTPLAVTAVSAARGDIIMKYAPPDWLNPAFAECAEELVAILYLFLRK